MTSPWELEGARAGDARPAATLTWVEDALDCLLDAAMTVPAAELLARVPVDSVTPARARRVALELRAQGHLGRAEALVEEIGRHRPDDLASVRRSLRGELAVLRGELRLADGAPAGAVSAVPGRLVIVAASTLPDVDTTQTRRTHALARAAVRAGLTVAVVPFMGSADQERIDVLDGVPYHRHPGPARGSIPLDQWAAQAGARLRRALRSIRPGAVIATSDLLTFDLARHACHGLEASVLYDVRGFAHESWLARQREDAAWATDLPARWGPPDAWVLRREREIANLRAADAVLLGKASLSDHPVLRAAAPARVIDLEDATSWESVLALLEDLSVVEAGTTDVLRTRTRATSTPETVRAALTADPSRPLERSIAGRSAAGVESVMTTGWAPSGRPPVRVDRPDFDWHTACQDNRSHAYLLHAWDFVLPCLHAWETRQDREALDWSIARATSWWAAFDQRDSTGTMAWYDMALALRAPRLAYLLDQAVRAGAPDEHVAVLLRCVERHQSELFASRAFNARTNHGFYTAIGQIAFARRLAPLPGMDLVLDQGRKRLREITRSQFHPDGGHVEHSPQYHSLVLVGFRDAADDGIITDTDVIERLRLAEDVLGWMIQPDAVLPQIGDSVRCPAPARSVTGQVPTALFQASAGERGTPDTRELLTLPDSGYAFVRSPQPQRAEEVLDAGYLTLMGSFHSRTHKHCDDLSITWFDGGTEVLVDAGRFGYLDQLPPDSPLRSRGFFYARPERLYVESTRAHNTIEVDGIEHDRVRREPYGSALTGGERRDGVFRVSARVDHGPWRHARVLTFAPGRWLLVTDTVESGDGRPHDFRAWWNLPDELAEPHLVGSRLSFERPEGRGRLHVVGLDDAEWDPPVSAQDEPLRGWRSMTDYELTPSWSTARVASQRTHHVFRTLFSLTDEPLTAVPDHPFTED